MIDRKRLRFGLRRIFSPERHLREKYGTFKKLLDLDRSCLKLITLIEDICRRPVPVDRMLLAAATRRLSRKAGKLSEQLAAMNPARYAGAEDTSRRLARAVEDFFSIHLPEPSPPFILPLENGEKDPSRVGGKAFHLGRIRGQTRIPVPNGFVITTLAFRELIDANRLQPEIDRRLRLLRPDRPKRFSRLLKEIRELILDLPVPETLTAAIRGAAGELADPGGSMHLALRSSAVSEDGEASFAGQYVSLLDVSPPDIVDAYRKVIAGKYSEQAVRYRIRLGIDDRETQMAVLVLRMLDPEASGVIYTRDPIGKCRGECLVLSAVRGSGARLVDGSLSPDIFLFSREASPRILSRESGPSLDEATAERLAGWGMELESFFGSPQDIEWVKGKNGELFILQSRPLPQEDRPHEESVTIEEPVSNRVLLSGCTVASSGIGIGPVFKLIGPQNMDEVPGGVVLVVRHFSPRLAQIAEALRGVVSEVGSRTSHFASVAREYRIPALVGAEGALSKLENGRAVTVDALEGLVYEGEAEPLVRRMKAGMKKEPHPFVKRMSGLLPLVSELRLTDPSEPGFSLSECRSFHDLVRFIHEKGIEEMFSLAEAKGKGMSGARRLDTDLPIVLHLIDLGNGLADPLPPGAVNPEGIASIPMQAVWEGLTNPGVTWAEGLVHIDWERFDRMSGGIFRLDSRILGSYALLSADYLNLMIRFGYHFAVLDALCGENPGLNYIRFRFKGGGGEYLQRVWRVEIIGRILSRFGFEVSSGGDMVEARYSREDRQTTEARLRLLGYLLGRTTLLDMAISDESRIAELTEEIASGFA